MIIGESSSPSYSARISPTIFLEYPQLLPSQQYRRIYHIIQPMEYVSFVFLIINHVLVWVSITSITRHVHEEIELIFDSLLIYEY